MKGVERERESVCVCVEFAYRDVRSANSAGLVRQADEDPVFKKRFLAITEEDGLKSKNVKRQKSLKIGQRFYILNFVIIG